MIGIYSNNHDLNGTLSCYHDCLSMSVLGQIRIWITKAKMIMLKFSKL